MLPCVLTLGAPPEGEPRGQPEHPRSQRPETVRDVLIPRLPSARGQRHHPESSSISRDVGFAKNSPSAPQALVPESPLMPFLRYLGHESFLDTAVSGAIKNPKALVSCKPLPLHPPQAVWGVACFQSSGTPALLSGPWGGPQEPCSKAVPGKCRTLSLGRMYCDIPEGPPTAT